MPSSPVSGAANTNAVLQHSESSQNELDGRYHRFRELLKNLNDREEELKQRWMQKDHILDRFYEQLAQNYKDLIDQEQLVLLTQSKSEILHEKDLQEKDLIYKNIVTSAKPKKK